MNFEFQDWMQRPGKSDPFCDYLHLSLWDMIERPGNLKASTIFRSIVLSERCAGKELQMIRESHLGHLSSLCESQSHAVLQRLRSFQETEKDILLTQETILHLRRYTLWELEKKLGFRWFR